MESNEKIADGRRERFMGSMERFTGLLLDRLAQTPSGKLMDEKETRMLASVVMKSYSLWMKAFTLKIHDQVFEEKPRRLQKRIPENIEKEV